MVLTLVACVTFKFYQAYQRLEVHFFKENAYHFLERGREEAVARDADVFFELNSTALQMRSGSLQIARLQTPKLITLSLTVSKLGFTGKGTASSSGTLLIQSGSEVSKITLSAAQGKITIQ